MKGRLKRGLYLSLGSRVVSARIGSFSERRSGGAEGDEAKGFRVRIGMFLVLQLRLATGGGLVESLSRWRLGRGVV